MQPSARQTLGFVAAVAVVASILVASSAVLLRDRQEFNALLDRRRNVLGVAGLLPSDTTLAPEALNARFERFLRPVVVTLETGQRDTTVDGSLFDQRAATSDPATSRVAPPNRARVARVPDRAMLYHVVQDDSLTALIFPVVGQGLWSTMYGYIALSPDLRTVTGLTFYEHGETAGLGGEISNPQWQARWRGRRAFDETWAPAIMVLKGTAGDAATDPFRVDGIAGATITGRGVQDTIHFWLGPEGFGPYLTHYREEAGIS
jgi:Na+-transporting NADH:ubiquinone oxidoreductase subunit C